MFTIPNLLSFSRLPLAFLFFHENPYVRGICILLAMLSDGLDGYLARKYKIISTIGTWLDPFTDKFFVLISLAVLLQEERLAPWQAASLLGRDFAILSFALYLAFKGKLSDYPVHAIWWGKITTAFQFIVLFGLVFYGALPSYFYLPFIVFGLLAFRELFIPIQQAAAE